MSLPRLELLVLGHGHERASVRHSQVPEPRDFCSGLSVSVRGPRAVHNPHHSQSTHTILSDHCPFAALSASVLPTWGSALVCMGSYSSLVSCTFNDNPNNSFPWGIFGGWSLWICFAMLITSLIHLYILIHLNLHNNFRKSIFSLLELASNNCFYVRIAWTVEKAKILSFKLWNAISGLIFIKAVKVLWIMKKSVRLQPVCRCLVWITAYIIFNGQFYHC